jgi:hypothetical protein
MSLAFLFFTPAKYRVPSHLEQTTKAWWPDMRIPNSLGTPYNITHIFNISLGHFAAQ